MLVPHTKQPAPVRQRCASGREHWPRPQTCRTNAGCGESVREHSCSNGRHGARTSGDDRGVDRITCRAAVQAAVNGERCRSQERSCQAVVSVQVVAGRRGKVTEPECQNALFVSTLQPGMPVHSVQRTELCRGLGASDLSVCVAGMAGWVQEGVSSTDIGDSAKDAGTPRPEGVLMLPAVQGTPEHVRGAYGARLGAGVAHPLLGTGPLDNGSTSEERRPGAEEWSFGCYARAAHKIAT